VSEKEHVPASPLLIAIRNEGGRELWSVRHREPDQLANTGWLQAGGRINRARTKIMPDQVRLIASKGGNERNDIGACSRCTV
jgi:hypothetical protein